MIRVTIYNEFLHEKEKEAVRALYPDGIHMTLKRALESEDIVVKTATLEDENCGLDEETLANTDVLIWWGHKGHKLVPDEVAQRVRDEVHKGMGAIFLHSSHKSKPFTLLMGTPGTLSWRQKGESELVWVVNPAHPIAQGVGPFIKLEHEETYGEPFGIPEPDQLVFIGRFDGGEVFRSGCCFQRGNGRIFYFQPGHETFPIFYHPDIIRVIKNAIEWAKPVYRIGEIKCTKVLDLPVEQ